MSSPFSRRITSFIDDVSDYSTNEPTMDGTAGTILLMAIWSRPADHLLPRTRSRLTVEARQ